MVGLCLSYRWLSWSNPQHPDPLPHCPEGISRTFIDTPSGQLEILSSSSSSCAATSKNKTPLFFVHGGMGGAWVWTEYLQYCAGRDVPAYAVSLRGHGGSWRPSYLRMVWATTKEMLADDAVAGIRWVQEKEEVKKDVVLVGHSSGGGLAQILLSRGDVQVKGLALLGAVPGYGSMGVYINWAKFDPWFMFRMLLHGYHPNSPLSHPALTKRAFFGDEIPDAYVEGFQRRICRYESFLWPFGMMRRFVNPAEVLRNVRGSGDGDGLKVLVMAGREDRMMTPGVMMRLAGWYRGGKEEDDDEKAGVVRCVFVEGAGHHLQNDVQWRDGAGKLMEFYDQLHVGV